MATDPSRNGSSAAEEYTMEVNATEAPIGNSPTSPADGSPTEPSEAGSKADAVPPTEADTKSGDY